MHISTAKIVFKKSCIYTDILDYFLLLAMVFWVIREILVMMVGLQRIKDLVHYPEYEVAFKT